ncbi:MAG: hypothetical protein SFX73_33385 [Kofleriaceae bacterium]|nr:hypothetical protein [Kofleriaceae bacterium]
MILDERILADGTHARTHASLEGERIIIRDDDGTAGALSIPAFDKVMTRYGRELDASVTIDGEALDLPGGYRLRRLRYHAVVDAEGRDYLVWERPGHEPVAVIAAMATAALRYLVLRLVDEMAGGSPPAGASKI